MRRLIGTLAALGLIGGAVWVGIRSDGSRLDAGSRASPSPSPSLAQPTPEVRSVGAIRRAIVQAAEVGDYEALRPLLEPETFLSDFGYGVDPIDRWANIGDGPLALMAAVLRMKHVEENTNEGRLIRWPVYDAETKSFDDITDRDRNLFLSVMSKREYRRLIPNEEYGYGGPRLGILEDGTWWFFIIEPGP